MAEADSGIDTSNMSPEEIAELQKQNCIFCKIASKQIPAKILHEDDKVICILDINPASEGHILIYPKEHYMILPHIPEDLLIHLFKTAQLMSKTLLKSLQTGGTSVFIANGMAAGQKAPHVLIHVFPRKMNDDLLKLPSYDMTDEQKKKLKNSLKPYFNQLFGPGKKLEEDTKRESHEEKNAQKKTSIEQYDDDDAEEMNDEEKSLKNEQKNVHHKKNTQASSDKKSTIHHKKDQEEKDTFEEEEDNSEDEDNPSEKEKKVDLDDIARLFGG